MSKKEFIKKLLDKGYKEFKPPSFSNYKNLEHAFQKRFDDEKGKKYFIDVYMYEDMFHPGTGKVFPGAIEFETQFLDAETDHPINLQFFAGCELEEAEDRIERLFQTGMFGYYEEWDE